MSTKTKIENFISNPNKGMILSCDDLNVMVAYMTALKPLHGLLTVRQLENDGILPIEASLLVSKDPPKYFNILADYQLVMDASSGKWATQLVTISPLAIDKPMEPSIKARFNQNYLDDQYVDNQLRNLLKGIKSVQIAFGYVWVNQKPLFKLGETSNEPYGLQVQGKEDFMKYYPKLEKMTDYWLKQQKRKN